jgi:hypothetical protein
MRKNTMEDFEELLNDENLLMEAKDQVFEMMKSREPDFAIAVIVALRDWLADHYDDETAYEILEEIADGLEE